MAGPGAVSVRWPAPSALTSGTFDRHAIVPSRRRELMRGHPEFARPRVPTDTYGRGGLVRSRSGFRISVQTDPHATTQPNDPDREGQCHTVTNCTIQHGTSCTTCYLTAPDNTTRQKTALHSIAQHQIAQNATRSRQSKPQSTKRCQTASTRSLYHCLFMGIQSVEATSQTITPEW